MKDAVWYDGAWLCKGSRALMLLEEARKGVKDGWQKLAQHLKDVDQKARQRGEFKCK